MRDGLSGLWIGLIAALAYALLCGIEWGLQ